MTTKKRVQVVVAGAGPVGSVAAMYLAMNGVDVILAELGADNAADLRASTFHPPTLEMLDQIKVTDFLMETGLKSPVYHWRDRQTGEIMPFDFAELAGDTKYPFRLQCEQHHLSGKLASRLNEESNAEVLFSHRLVWFQQDDDGVEVALETPTGIEPIRADYLIGADGASSIVRKWLGIEFDGFTYPERFLCLSTEQEIRDEVPDLAYVNYISDAQEWMVLLRVPRLWRVLVPANGASNEELLSEEKKAKVFDGFLKDGASVQTHHRTIYRAHQRVAKQFRKDRVLLVGDAAHLNNPLGGFGMNSGVHDAFNLCERLVDVIKGGDNGLLDQFDRQRRTVTHAFTQKQTIENMEAMRGGQGEAHARRRDKMRALLTNDDERRKYLLRQSMIDSLRDAAAIA
ncbi:monooxygenase [Novosphingobium barchaimii LL02]|uniref:Monooxygenase n=1 Tax=Novosphingobium barchaimii LL02 TaxID=1114963 RepID=A0A0J7XXM9_9SPHN|nr:FAD-dependent monooxygenase [Novosphingobium barchaimii]KMS56431.1 monooxygenase [Novosphingobium barchaimii LL02]